MRNWQLIRNASGRLMLKAADGTVHEGVVPVRAFPIAAPDRGIALVSAEGRELAWIDSFGQLDDESRCLIEEELATREFIPEIRCIRGVSDFATPSIWEVETDRGQTSLTLKDEEDIRRISARSLLVADCHGIQYLIPDRHALDAASRRLLDRFL